MSPLPSPKGRTRVFLPEPGHREEAPQRRPQEGSNTQRPITGTKASERHQVAHFILLEPPLWMSLESLGIDLEDNHHTFTYVFGAQSKQTSFQGTLTAYEPKL